MKVYRVQGVTISKQNSEAPPYFDTQWTDKKEKAESDFKAVQTADFISQIDDKTMIKLIFGFEVRLISADVDRDVFEKMQSAKSIDQADSLIGYDYYEDDSILLKP